ncbi:MAG: type II toxin-antitoxin system RelE/ParE family toxin [Elusimicrobia bacterium]|nr:type II toxin-antitoxin system RelE/ParE family toxin [Elusimicrobiota bacterium]
MYKIKLIPPAQRDLDKLKGKIFEQVKRKIIILATNPRPHGCEKLTRSEGYRVRIRNLRILYRVDDRRREVIIYRVRHRGDVYR